MNTPIDERIDREGCRMRVRLPIHIQHSHTPVRLESQMDHATVVQQIRSEIYLAFEILGARRELLATIGSWGDTLDDGEVLTLLKKSNAESSHADPKQN